MPSFTCHLGLARGHLHNRRARGYRLDKVPDRGDETTGARASIALRITVAELMSIGARLVGASETLFIVGSTLAYIGRLQKCYRGPAGLLSSGSASQ